ncbi:lysylphosphatidylglycerol synthase transmembrane domain-containing protein [Acutalibacter sp. 1XD8-33]|uniref:lysylphosphatidylglycerol synthase transmembrane domain-containing protein n=1 Tax=Acutalibacter sp. 1XD8-33 TaxID=2320081 RepID=UPI001314F385|nr:lysylphosphatidylglycerol synthase transmembrane domain-containing protein [Acutalibacter sp. 1XD8-33]
MERAEGKKRKIPWGMLYIGATIVAVLLFGLFNREFGNVFYTITHLTPGFLTAAVAITVAYFFFEGGIIRLLMNSQNIAMSLWSSMKIGLIGIYYSYITPSSTGGQPMQAAYLRRDKIPVGLSTAVLIMKFFCFQCAFVFCSLISILFMREKIARENPGILPFIAVGLIINGASILFFGSMFFRPVLGAVCRFAKWLAGRFPKLSQRFHVRETVDKFEADFDSYTDDFKEKKKSVLWGILLSVPQFVLQMSVLYFVFRSFGYHQAGFFEIFAMQSLLQVSVSFMPMPGASGAQEIGFSNFLRPYFVNNDLYAAVMVWRFFTYYLVVIAGAILVVVDQFLYGRKKAGTSEEELSQGN